MIELRPIKQNDADFDAVEVAIKRVLKETIYAPLLALLPKDSLRNAPVKSALTEAIKSGRVVFKDGVFSGKFTAAVSKELRELGATWDRPGSAWHLKTRALPTPIQEAITRSESRFTSILLKIDKKLSDVSPAEVAGKIRVSDMIDKTLFKVQKLVADTLKAITIEPQLTPKARKQIADEWEGNLQKWIKDFTGEEIKKLRADVQKHTLAGGRYEGLIQTIEESYGVSKRKAKFLAKQETSLLMSKFKEARYTDANVSKYRWRCVAGSAAHPVRPSHKILDGKIFQWDAPPITSALDEPARRNNPGEDYNCRCFAIPIVEFRPDASDQTTKRRTG